ncbi:hypothetical protein GLOIN_2v1487654 [Rhizophagus irregularis DAOM 181602=DAOM 197198]|uniref:Uncharacterized protein n=1 Tax=Rhizophagus irregularis (strain DAOM 181602 / DAOM 197198 / MUCL 43194) TaxID=747089 RepID=A0A2P4P2L0_RHIID|nr:hypothetical protein GLOIN_2v1487654 [Rhizophagus irregularis DAOM 181602=DAOM 197198]POG59621.1 hypothetical protein GLOIN_2v1487654 [Rhizophagus irregularis DAOM 181602=DAOM 197198]|eukprot:XP_025166487.1 hypothetical protein GLOIN_2v1487654 [Rhizophagus irregularis DAOM 181602=DAOM 197198]
MNQKRFIILLTLLIFFLIHVDKTHGSCYPIGVRKDCDKEWDGANIIDASWVPGAPILNITTYVPDGGNGPNYPEAFGHFTFGNDQVKYRFLKKPIFVNDHHCTYTSPDEKNPYVSYWPHDESLRPAPGTWHFLNATFPNIPFPEVTTFRIGPFPEIYNFPNPYFPNPNFLMINFPNPERLKSNIPKLNIPNFNIPDG